MENKHPGREDSAAQLILKNQVERQCCDMNGKE